MAVYPKIFTYLDYGAPTLNGQAGSLITVLDACLKDGYGSRGMGAMTQTAGICQATVGSNHGLLPGQALLIAGADQAAYNGEQKILSVGFNTVTFAVPSGTVSPATGASITFKLAPLGWTKLFSGTNLAAYRCASPQYIGPYLRVDDNPVVFGLTNRVARVQGYEAMSDINTGTGLFPTTTQINLPLWLKSYVADSTARPWAIFGDDRCFYLWTCPNTIYTPNSNGQIVFFGDLDAPPGIDSFATCLTAVASDQTSSGSAITDCMGYSVASASYTHYFPRPPNGLGGSVRGGHVAAMFSASGYSGQGWASVLGYPNGSDNALLLHPVYGFTQGSLRGTHPGLLHTGQNLGATNFTSMQVIDGARALAGRKLMYVPVCLPQGTYVNGAVFFDLTGPWRQY